MEGKQKQQAWEAGTSSEVSIEKLTIFFPSDASMRLSVYHLNFSILESDFRPTQLVDFGGYLLFLKVSHHTLGSTFVVTTSLQGKDVSVHCFNRERPSVHEDGIGTIGGYSIFTEEEIPSKKPMLWVDRQSNCWNKGAQFLGINIIHVIPYHMHDIECHKFKLSAKISGVRLGGGMSVRTRMFREPDI